LVGSNNVQWHNPWRCLTRTGYSG